MKLRFRGNSLRLRVNRREVERVAAGESIREQVLFPHNVSFSYTFEPGSGADPCATFEDNALRVSASLAEIREWARSDSVGLYFDIPASSETLKIAIEKDLECVDGPLEERDPEAFPRHGFASC